MHLFFVTVTCISTITGACPLKTITTHVAAANAIQCSEKVTDVILHFGDNPRNYAIKCDEHK